MKTLAEIRRDRVANVAKVPNADFLPSGRSQIKTPARGREGGYALADQLCGLSSQVPGVTTDSDTLRDWPWLLSVMSYLPAGSCKTP